MRRLIVICLLAAMVAYGIGLNPVAVMIGAPILFFFLGFVRGYFDPEPTKLQCYGNAAMPTSI